MISILYIDINLTVACDQVRQNQVQRSRLLTNEHTHEHTCDANKKRVKNNIKCTKNYLLLARIIKTHLQ